MTTANDLSLLSNDTRSFLHNDKGMFIDGGWRPASDGATLAVVDPSSGEEFIRIADASEEDVDAAVGAARRALTDPAWAGLQPFRREALMLALADALEAETQMLAEIETLNSGKLIGNTRLFDAELPVHSLRYVAGWASRLNGETIDLSVPYLPDMRFSGMTKRFPVGVVAAITPWNVPLCMAVWKLAPVLATGCTIVLKPAEQTSLTALRLAELCAEIGIPDGVVNVITGSGAKAGRALVNHPGVDKISFTGSTEVGREIAVSAAANFKKYNLELGGKSPLIITESANLDDAIPGAAWAIFGNSGQNCCAGSRMLVHEKHYDTVLAGVREIAASAQLGPGLDPQSQIAPLSSQLHRDRVSQHVVAAREAGADVSGGECVGAPGSYFTPAVISGLDHGHSTAQSEIFGPVLCAFSFSNDEEAIALANDTRYGLGASVWTKDIDCADSYFDQLEAGTVWINTHNILDPSIPFGGEKESGVGHELAREGVLAHTKLRAGIKLRS